MPYNTPCNYFDKNNLTLAGSETHVNQKTSQMNRTLNSQSVTVITNEKTLKLENIANKPWEPTSTILRSF